MHHGIFSTLMADSEQRQRTGAVQGLRYAEIRGVTEDGLYLLEWLSGPVRSPSAPARALRFMAGNRRGAYFPFEVGDEVLAGFIDGDLDQPVILGALWSDQDPPPDGVDTTETNNTRAIVSREGSRLAFDDSPAATSVLLKSAGGIEILLDDAGMSLTIKLNETTKIVLSAAGVTITGTIINLN
jgi:uncharacterized protein involved in type VI secretion and phage assembly